MKCVTCGNEFSGRIKNAKYCSKKCRNNKVNMLEKLKRKKKSDQMSVLDKLKMKHGLKCWYCGRKIEEKASIDHIKAVGNGGNHELDNLALSCMHCNYAKFNYDVTEFLEWLSHIRSSNFECLVLGKLSKAEIESIDCDTWDKLRKDFW